jgi:sugar lactone lactonase YvrE
MSRDGSSKVLADSIDGEAIGKVNFVLRDSKDRIWITVSTRIKNWMHALRTDLADGYLARYEGGAFRIVADGFHFTNEIRFDAKEEFLYVVETTGGCITRMKVDDKGGLGNREIFGPSRLGKGAWPDGIAFDAYGNLWGTLVYSDKLFVLTPGGDLRVLLDEGDPARVDELERAFFENRVTEKELFATGRGVAPWMASVTFGGSDLRTVYIGSLKGERIPYFRTPVAGLPMVHWHDSYQPVPLRNQSAQRGEA